MPKFTTFRSSQRPEPLSHWIESFRENGTK